MNTASQSHRTYPDADFTAARPIPVILDTDMGNDVDDALALGFLHELESRQVVRLLAVVLTIPNPQAAPFVGSLNAFYGRPSIPVGIRPEGVQVWEHSPFLPLAEQRLDGGSLLYPRTEATPEHSVRLMRKTLAAAAPRSVVIIQIGFFSNLAALLDSAPDEFSSLGGCDLVREKVALASVMAGAFRPFDGSDRYLEFNVRYDVPAARKVAGDWPSRMVWSGIEVGQQVGFPAWSINEDFSYIPHHPLRESYQRYKPTPHERPTWDLTSVAYAAFPSRGYFDVSPRGKVSVESDGFTTFAPAEGGRDQHLSVDRFQAERLKELFAAYVSSPPRL